MEKVGIVTLFESDNFGTCLQAYALQQTIMEFGYTTEIVNHRHNSLSGVKTSVGNKALNVFQEQGLLRLIEVMALRKYSKEKAVVFRSFRNSYLCVTDEEYRTFEEMHLLNEVFDAFVCGSDMIWAQESNRDLDIYLLQFVDPSKRIAYAPSFGRADIPSDEIKRYQDGIGNFQFLSCREASGVDIIRDLVGREAELVVDPTLLLTAKQWSSMFASSSPNEDYILCYMFGGLPKSFKKNLGYLKSNLGCRVKYIPGKLSEFVHERSAGAYGPEEYVRLYANAKFIIANSYHGLIFSLIFNKPFILLHRDEREYWSRYEDRMQSILHIVGLEERYRHISQPIDDKLLQLDYSSINEQLEEWRARSRDYLRNALYEVTNNQPRQKSHG